MFHQIQNLPAKYILLFIHFHQNLIKLKTAEMKIFIDEIIEIASDNSAGTILDESAISEVVSGVLKTHCLQRNYIDHLIETYETDSGYLVKSSDIISVLKPYLIVDSSVFEEIEKPEKDFELIELLYGDFQEECGDR